METIKHKVSGKLFPPIRVRSEKNTQTIINGEKITFKEGDEVVIKITHINVPLDHTSDETLSNYSYDIKLSINEGTLGLTRSITHTLELLLEITKLKDNDGQD